MFRRACHYVNSRNFPSPCCQAHRFNLISITKDPKSLSHLNAAKRVSGAMEQHLLRPVRHIISASRTSNSGETNSPACDRLHRELRRLKSRAQWPSLQAALQFPACALPWLQGMNDSVLSCSCCPGDEAEFHHGQVRNDAHFPTSPLRLCAATRAAEPLPHDSLSL